MSRVSRNPGEEDLIAAQVQAKGRKSHHPGPEEALAGQEM